ncbi:MAG TPA: hypothetical protein VJ810_02890 [Blastocatellia bacterium]|nr:hypothetical protein [Blastocatellia bacterium]
MFAVKESNVTINFDGLMLFSFNESNNYCETKVNTSAEGHQMSIKVSEAGKVLYQDTFSSERLRDLGSLSLFVCGGKGLTPIGRTAKKGPDYDLILDLEGDDFYQRPCELKQSEYESSIFLHNGTIDAGNRVRSYRVKEEFFSELKYQWEDQDDWDTFKRRSLEKDADSIVEFQQEYARDVAASVPIQEGQSLRFVSSSTKTDLFAPLEFGKNYQIDIRHTDIDDPSSLSDCIGFAHHCEALNLKRKEPVYGIFRPYFKGMRTNCDSACCVCARISPKPNESLSFWDLWKMLFSVSMIWEQPITTTEK